MEEVSLHAIGVGEIRRYLGASCSDERSFVRVWVEDSSGSKDLRNERYSYPEQDNILHPVPFHGSRVRHFEPSLPPSSKGITQYPKCTLFIDMCVEPKLPNQTGASAVVFSQFVHS